jgi:hypothetical protein
MDPVWIHFPFPIAEEKNEQGFVIFCQGFEEELQLLDDLESQCARHPEV